MRIHTRRAALGTGLAVAGGALLAACSGGGDDSPERGSRAPAGGPEGHVSLDGEGTAAAGAERGGGPELKVRLTAARTCLDLGGRTVSTWAYDDRIPGREIRLTAGDILAATLVNHLPEATTIHWHGLAVRNDMDGVPGITQRPVRPGGDFTYRFVAPHPGTYWFHPHTGVQLDRGLYAPLIIEDPKEPLRYDKEWVVVLDDWVDGVDGSTPDAVLAELSNGMAVMHHGGHGMSHMSMAAGEPPAPRYSGPSRLLTDSASDLLGGHAGDVAYPFYLVNGRTSDDPETFRAKPGDRIRLRVINAGGETAFRVALGGHRMTITHTDGFPVEHIRTDALLLGMGERYDVLVTAKDGVFPLTALAEGKRQTAMAVLRTSGGSAPAASVRPEELYRTVVTAAELEPADSVRLRPAEPDRTIWLRLTGSMDRYDWGINGKRYDPSQRHFVHEGERVRLVFTNRTMMWHPVHLHGHHFALANGGPRKDTAIVLPRQTLSVEFDAANPGLWMVHCHNVYHSEAGMMTILAYRS